MWNKIKCYFGWHVWDTHLHYKKPSGDYTNFPVRVCDNCDRKERHIGLGRWVTYV